MPPLVQTEEGLAPTALPPAPPQGYGRSVDMWALGALAYEMLTGEAPFYDKARKELYRKIMGQTGRLTFPKFMSPAAVSLIKALLERNVDKRLGCGPGVGAAAVGAAMDGV